MFSAVFHAMMFGPLWSRLAPYIRDIVPMEMRATGQSLWCIMTLGLGPILGALISGLVVRNFGLRNLFLAVAILEVLVVAVFAVLFRKQRRIDIAEGFKTE
jgi:MFS family permease